MTIAELFSRLAGLPPDKEVRIVLEIPGDAEYIAEDGDLLDIIEVESQFMGSVILCATPHHE